MVNILCGFALGILVCKLMDGIWYLYYRRHGKGEWQNIDAVNEYGTLYTRYRCSKCGEDSKDRTKYCGHCRTEMDLEE